MYIANQGGERERKKERDYARELGVEGGVSRCKSWMWGGCD